MNAKGKERLLKAQDRVDAICRQHATRRIGLDMLLGTVGLDSRSLIHECKEKAVGLADQAELTQTPMAGALGVAMAEGVALGLAVAVYVEADA